MLHQNLVKGQDKDLILKVRNDNLGRRVVVKGCDLLILKAIAHLFLVFKNI